MDLVVIDEGRVDIVRAATHERPEGVIATHGAGRFLGELTLLTGQVVYLTARVVEEGHVHRISAQRFRQLIDADPELCDLLLRAFLARRMFLRAGAAAQALEIVGSSLSAATLALRTYAARHLLPQVIISLLSSGSLRPPAAGRRPGSIGATAVLVLTRRELEWVRSGGRARTPPRGLRP